MPTENERKPLQASETPNPVQRNAAMQALQSMAQEAPQMGQGPSIPGTQRYTMELFEDMFKGRNPMNPPPPKRRPKKRPPSERQLAAQELYEALVTGYGVPGEGILPYGNIPRQYTEQLQYAEPPIGFDQSRMTPRAQILYDLLAQQNQRR